MEKVMESRPSRTVVAVIIRRGQTELVRRIAPALRVVREHGKPPRVEPVEAST